MSKRPERFISSLSPRNYAHDLIQGLFYGYYDGITGLVREPMEGAKKEVGYSCFFFVCSLFTSFAQGFIGAIKGSARSCELKFFLPFWVRS